MQPIGLYIHIPFCHRLCHYCDFAKSARFDNELVEAYFARLKKQIKEDLPLLYINSSQNFSSVYFGGGTPSLFPDQIRELMALITPYLTASIEVTLEANPEDITGSSLRIWQQAGINRLSLGIQSFQEPTLRYLTREHTPQKALQALDLSLATYPNVNVDIIFGIPGQNKGHLHDDLAPLIRRKVPHISLYGLTYEGNTPLARRYRRGKLKPMAPDLEAELFRRARQILCTEGYLHEEVSNFARDSFTARHNSLYWQGKSYIGLGTGSHGYLLQLPDHPFGLRYQIPFKINRFIRDTPKGLTPLEVLQHWGAEIEQRQRHDWLLEMILSGLRSHFGIDLKFLENSTHLHFSPTPAIQRALTKGLCQWDRDHVFYLHPDEWYREALYVIEVYESFKEVTL